MSKNVKEKPGEKPPERVGFDYLKSASFRSVRADGLIGSITPNGHIHMAWYSERPAIPQRAVYNILPDGRLGEEEKSLRQSRETTVREMDFDLFLTLPVAKSVHRWLGERIKELEQRELLPKSKEE